jgi:hypothetical protein
MGLDIDFEFDVGEEEKHRVAFHWGQLWGKLRITVDGVEVVQKNQPFSLFRSTKVRKFEFSVGEPESHAVVIEKTKPRFMGGARRQRCRAFVDGELYGEY